mmetsp:Transcript_5500/g.8520  ORF Transcript_5500/g.8520 Transcript_5500/m.8520 type:complete len:189 (-) Transcript_5500:693-1259(-)
MHRVVGMDAQLKLLGNVARRGEGLKKRCETLLEQVEILGRKIQQDDTCKESRVEEINELEGDFSRYLLSFGIVDLFNAQGLDLDVDQEKLGSQACASILCLLSTLHKRLIISRSLHRLLKDELIAITVSYYSGAPPVRPQTASRVRSPMSPSQRVYSRNRPVASSREQRKRHYEPVAGVDGVAGVGFG